MARFPSAIQCVGVLVAVMLMSDAVNAEVTTCKVCANCGTSSTGTSTSCSTGGTSNYYCFKTVTNAFDAFIVINRGCTASVNFAYFLSG